MEKLTELESYEKERAYVQSRVDLAEPNEAIDSILEYLASVEQAIHNLKHGKTND